MDQMEEYFQHLDLLPHQESTDTGLLQLKFQYLDLCSTFNVVKSAIYIVPAYHQSKLFVRYMEKGVYKGFTPRFISAFTEKYNIAARNVFP